MDPGDITRNQSLCLAVSHCLKDYGATRLDLLHLAIEGRGAVDVFFEGCWGFSVDAQYVPFVLGVCHGLSKKDLCKIIRSLSIDPITFIRSVSIYDDYILLADKTKLTRMSLCTKMMHLFFELDAEAALAAMKQHIVDTPILTKVFLASGRVDNLLHKMISDEYLAVSCGEEVYGDTLQSLVSYLPFNVNSFEFFPDGSIGNYLDDSAAFNPFILKKTLSANLYWEDIFASACSSHLSTEFCKSILEYVFSREFSSVNKKKLRLMLSNLVMEFPEQEFEYDDLFSETLSVVKNSAVSEFADKTIFHLSLVRGFQESNVDPLSLREIFNDPTLRSENVIGMFKSLIDLDDRLLEQVIKETLALPSNCIGYHLLSLPFVLKNLQLPKQKVELGLFEHYLVSLAEAAADYVIENDSLGAKQDMDIAIHEGMKHWFEYLNSSQQIDAGLLARSSDRAAEQLVRWGLDIHNLPAPGDRAMTLALELDLGL